MIEIKNLYKSYGDFLALKDLNLTINDGSVFGLIGTNGVGKSTLLRIIAGVYKADKGGVLFDGKGVFENENVKKDIFFLPDDPYFTPNATGKSLTELYKTFYQFDDEIFNKYIKTFKLNLLLPVRNFSKGMKRQLFISLALACRPKYLFLDEAFDGLDPLARLEFKRGLIELTDEIGSTIIISSHSLRELEDICSSYGLVDHKQIVSSGEIEEQIEKVHKFQVAFDREITKKDLGFDCLSFVASGRVVKLIAKGDKNSILEKIKALKPLLVDEVAIDFEELFICEVESRGYLK